MAASGSTDSLVGKQLGAYRVEALLGEGAMGEVYRGVHVALGRPVAIKTLKAHVAADRSLCERFFAEARAVNIIRHENIVECTDLVNEPGSTYIVMEMLEGKTLGAAIREAGRLPARRAAKIVAQIADAIGAAHDKGIVHRDLKPDNVFLIRRAGTSDYVKVLDFGIARLRPELGAITATQTGALIGTPAYMSPEQVSGLRAGPAADIYALGVILYQLLSGRLPFEAPSVPLILAAHVTQEPAPLAPRAPDAPPALIELVARCLAKAPEARPASMAALRRQVLEAVGLVAEEQASLVSAGPASGALVVPAGSGAGGRAASAAEAFDETVPPPGPTSAAPGIAVGSGVGASSVSGATGQVVKPDAAAELPGTRVGGAAIPAAAAQEGAGGGGRRGWILGGVAVAAAAGVIAVVLGGGGDGSAETRGGGSDPGAEGAGIDAASLAVVPPPPSLPAVPDAAVAVAATLPPAGPVDAGVAPVAVPAGGSGGGGGGGKKKPKPDAGVAVRAAPPPAGPADAGPKKKDLTKELLDDEENK